MPSIEVDTVNGLPSEEYKVSAVQASRVMLAEALTLKQKWYPKIYNRVNNRFEMLSKFMSVNMDEIEARIEHLQRQVNEEVAHNNSRSGVVGESSRASEDLAPSTHPSIEEHRRYNTRKKQYQRKKRR
ncbi:hypothetical protein AMTR_s00016p00211010 [Amborella trichopoda]|uniref:Uncharacterized protein n=1 Tax=Amborella trichopoda TaxID=13333 RepID=W1PF69_AMBTC|nr:hypothetical protein AMTR_s00016p00211010 [Amborella trichopoda]